MNPKNPRERNRISAIVSPVAMELFEIMVKATRRSKTQVLEAAIFHLSETTPDELDRLIVKLVTTKN